MTKLNQDYLPVVDFRVLRQVSLPISVGRLLKHRKRHFETTDGCLKSQFDAALITDFIYFIYSNDEYNWLVKSSSNLVF